MLDSDLAILYQCKNGTKEINQAVRNNHNKFPLRFTFRITEEESSNLKSNILTSKTRGGSRKGHTVFTEQGVAMLATILKTEVAAEISIRIMDAFVSMRKYISSSLVDQSYYNHMIIRHDTEIKLLQESFTKINNKEQNNHIFYEGQIYDAYSLMIDILRTSRVSIIIIDNYLDKVLLDIFSKINKEIIIITNKYNNDDYDKYKKQYKNIELRINNSFHDRFIIVDNKYLYHCGASFKDLGKKCFAINKMEDSNYLRELLESIK